MIGKLPLALLVLFLIVLTFCGCKSETLLPHALCEDGESRCRESTVQHCSETAWIDYDDCTLENRDCVVRNGEASCLSSTADTEASAKPKETSEAGKGTGEGQSGTPKAGEKRRRRSRRSRRRPRPRSSCRSQPTRVPHN